MTHGSPQQAPAAAPDDQAARAKLAGLVLTDPIERRRAMQTLLRLTTTRRTS